MPDSDVIEKMDRDLEKAAARIRSARDFLIVAHIDADGITSAAIATETCRRLGKDYDIIFAKKMDEITIDYLLAVLASRFGQFDVAQKMIASILLSKTANSRIKDRARDLKEQVLSDMKAKGEL